MRSSTTPIGLPNLLASLASLASLTLGSFVSATKLFGEARRERPPTPQEQFPGL